MTAQPVRQMPARPFKARNETREKSASVSVWLPGLLRDSCPASEFRRLAQEMGRQGLPGGRQPGREESLVFAFASLCGLLHGPQACLGPRIAEHYSMAPRPASSANSQDSIHTADSGIRRRQRARRQQKPLFSVPENFHFRLSGEPVVLAIRSVFVYSHVVFG